MDAVQHSSGLKWLGNSVLTGNPSTTAAALSTKSIVPGLANLGGNACFLNSSLQAMASLPSFLPFLQAIKELSISTEIEAPVTTSLIQLFHELNAPSTSQRTLKPHGIIQSLYTSSPERSRRILNSDQQDAQEFFVLLFQAVVEELQKMEKQIVEDAVTEEGLHSIREQRSPSSKTLFSPQLKNPFQSLLAHRIACLTCGYMEAIRHLSSDQLSLNVPLTRTCRLKDILTEYTKLELVEGYTCRQCTLRATLSHLQDQTMEAKDSVPKGDNMTPSKKRRIKELNKVAEKVKQALEEDVERDLGDVKLVKMSRPASKHTMFARPADCFVIHLSRTSSWTAYGDPIKNTCQVVFPETLSLDEFCTSGQLLSRPEAPISRADGKETEDSTMRMSANIYNLVAMVVHLGSHSYGHYVTYRKTQADPSAWFRLSDDQVRPCSIDEILGANPFLLFYERSKGLTLTTLKNQRSSSLARIVHRDNLLSAEEMKISYDQ